MLIEFGYKTYVSGSRSTNGMSLYYLKIFYNLEVLAFSQRHVQEDKNSKKIRITMSTQDSEKKSA
jgi:hypothetical protein